MYYNVTVGCFRIEASGMHRQEALTREAVCHASPLAYIVGPHGFLKEASTCRIETTFYVCFEDVSFLSHDSMDLFDGVMASPSWSESIAVWLEYRLPFWLQAIVCGTILAEGASGDRAIR
jgi:hypothetical protein